MSMTVSNCFYAFPAGSLRKEQCKVFLAMNMIISKELLQNLTVLLREHLVSNRYKKSGQVCN